MSEKLYDIVPRSRRCDVTPHIPKFWMTQENQDYINAKLIQFGYSRGFEVPHWNKFARDINMNPLAFSRIMRGQASMSMPFITTMLSLGVDFSITSEEFRQMNGMPKLVMPEFTTGYNQNKERQLCKDLNRYIKEQERSGR